MEFFTIFFVCLIVFAFIIFVIRVPIMIAKCRGITGDRLNNIVLLSWLGLLFGITWTVAFVLSLIYDSNDTSNDKLERLEKLHNLKKKGIITQKEYDRERKKLI